MALVHCESQQSADLILIEENTHLTYIPKSIQFWLIIIIISSSSISSSSSSSSIVVVVVVIMASQLWGMLYTGYHKAHDSHSDVYTDIRLRKCDFICLYLGFVIFIANYLGFVTVLLLKASIFKI